MGGGGNSSGSCVPKAHQGCVKRSQRRAKTGIDKGKGATKTKRAGLAKTLLVKKNQHNVGEKGQGSWEFQQHRNVNQISPVPASSGDLPGQSG